MAKLTNHLFSGRADDGTQFSYTAEVSVSTSGQFQVVYPIELEDTMQAVLSRVHGWSHPFDLDWEREVGQERIKRWRNIQLEKLKVNRRACGPVLDVVIEFVQFVIDQHLQCEKIEDLVILYTYDHKYCVGYNEATGEYASDAASPGFSWRGNLHATELSSHYRVGLAAFVRRRVKYVRPSGTRVLYECPREEMNSNPVMSDLGRMVGLKFYDPNENRGFGVAHPSYEVMPYSDEAARFFINALRSVAQLAHRLHGFFADRNRVQAAIAAQDSILAIQHSTVEKAE